MNKYYLIIFEPTFEYHEFTTYMWLINFLEYAKQKYHLDKGIYKIIEGKEILKGEEEGSDKE